MDVLKTLKEERKRKGVKQSEMASAMCISQTHYSMIERGERGTSLWRIEDALKHLGFTLLVSPCEFSMSDLDSLNKIKNGLT